ncbi:sugar transferase [Collinsella tanakaei]|nr:sugar transferase [Collinsella tanakaei]
MARHAGPLYGICKRAFDIIFSAFALAVSAVPAALICLLVRLESPGAAIYAQERVGLGGRPIRVHKIRSMVADAEDVGRYLDAAQLAQWEAERKVDGDPRITRVGRLIRATSLDELPQFWDVLVGDMSVVGPRPITRGELEAHFTPSERDELLSVRPGITGAWQAGARNGATFESGEWQAIELGYVRGRGFRLDTECMLGTFGAMFGNRQSGR